MRDIRKYEDRFELKGARFFADDQKKTVYVGSGYRIVKGVNSSYITGNKESHSAKFDNYMLQVGPVKVFEDMKDLYTQDLVDFIDEEGKRTAGVVIYDSTNFLFAVKDFKGENHPLHACKIMFIFPHVYERPDLIGMSLSDIYRKLGLKMREELPADEITELESQAMEETASESKQEEISAELAEKIKKNAPVPLRPKLAAEKKTEEASALDLFIAVEKHEDNAVWKYLMEYGGKKAGNKGKFNKAGNDGYYMAASLAIALSKINCSEKKKLPIRIHTDSKVLHNILMGGLLDVWSSSGWRKDSGEAVKNADILMAIKNHLDRLGGSYSVVLHEESPLRWTA